MKLPLEPVLRTKPLPQMRAAAKRLFDLALALLITPLIAPIALMLIFFAWRSTGSAIFSQTRAGRYGVPFTVYKICTMRPVEGFDTTVTTDGDPRITRFGRFLRKSKADEFPQLVNIFKGDMSFVGPRPDVPEAFASMPDRYAPVLCLRPGITGPATMAFRNEEAELAAVDDPERHNIEVLMPQKMEYNMAYIRDHSFLLDLKIIGQTFLHAVT